MALSIYKTKNQRSRGFTIIELMIVIALIALLAGLIIVSLSIVRARARNVIRKSDLRELRLALEMYANDHNGGYPISKNCATIVSGVCMSGWMTQEDYCAYAPWATSVGYGSTGYIPSLVPDYIKELPSDPNINPAGRCYGYSSDGKTYRVIAHHGAELGLYDDNDPMIRCLNSTCTSTQDTYFLSGGPDATRDF